MGGVPVTAAVLRSKTNNLRAAWTQQRTKEKRYREAATEAGMLLHGLYGRWGENFSHMLNHFISLGAANTNIPRAILANYWHCRILVCLQSGVANAINTRSNRLKTARTLGAGGLHSSHGEAFFPGLRNNRRRFATESPSVGTLTEVKGRRDSDEQSVGLLGPGVFKLEVWPSWRTCCRLSIKFSKRISYRFSSLVDLNYFLRFKIFGCSGVYFLGACVCALFSVSWFLSCFSVNLNK
jgi:hypothetical protein